MILMLLSYYCFILEFMVIVAKYLCKDMDETADFRIAKENKSMLKEFLLVYL